jgi:hypothetical protein
MATLELTDAQVADLVRRLPAERRRAVLLLLATEAQERREERLTFAEHQLRRVSAERGLDWDALSEPEREALIDDLIHEDRPCH